MSHVLDVRGVEVQVTESSGDGDRSSKRRQARSSRPKLPCRPVISSAPHVFMNTHQADRAASGCSAQDTQSGRVHEPHLRHVHDHLAVCGEPIIQRCSEGRTDRQIDFSERHQVDGLVGWGNLHLLLLVHVTPSRIQAKVEPQDSPNRTEISAVRNGREVVRRTSPRLSHSPFPWVHVDSAWMVSSGLRRPTFFDVAVFVADQSAKPANNIIALTPRNPRSHASRFVTFSRTW